MPATTWNIEAMYNKEDGVEESVNARCDLASQPVSSALVHAPICKRKGDNIEMSDCKGKQ